MLSKNPNLGGQVDRFIELKVFVAVSEEGGFAAAARRLQMSPPAVTRAVVALEKRLGIELLKRTTRHVRLTAAGEHYLENARKILGELASADAAVLGAHSTPTGQLSVTAPVMFGKKFVVPGVVEFLTRYPETRVSFALLDRVVNILDEGFDIGIRIGPLPDSSLRAIRVGQVNWAICASPQYLAENGTPSNVSELVDHPVVALSEGLSNVRWVFTDMEQSKTVQLKPRFSVTNTDAALAAGKLGYGFVRLLSYQVADALEDGSLVQVFSDCTSVALPLHILHREGRVGSALARGFIDLMVTRLRAEKCLNP